MFRRPLAAALAVLTLALSAVVIMASPVAAHAQVDQATELAVSESPGSSYGDSELIAALRATDLVDEWFAASPVSPQAALLAVEGSASYATARQAFLDDVAAFTERHRHLATRADRVENAQAARDELTEIVRQVRRSLARDSHPGEVLDLLAQIEGKAHWLGFSLDPLALAEHRLVKVRDEIAHEVRSISDVSGSAKSPAASIARLSDLQADLSHLDELIATSRSRGAEAQTQIALQRAAAVAQIPELHRARTLNRTDVGGLPLVTIDAYIRGAAVLDASCPVDWTLLAGIGRIESRHGTLDGATVQASGRVTLSIYGPLLDGGATKREAAAALIAAEEEALLAEKEAAEEAQRLADEAFEDSVWGQLQREADARLGLAEEAFGRPDTADQEGGNPADGDGDLEPEVEAEPPQFDPALWGEPAVSTATDDPDSSGRAASPEDEPEEDDDEEPVVKGNGFAVISDSDNGRLDGNPRWDRAVGPMQFIPETWSYWETDGNADGVLDPQNLYDAAASAGQFLCHLSRTRGSSPWTFVLGYNSSSTYVRNVMAAAETFRIAELPDVDALTS